MKINEIFYSISGESIQSGFPAIFIRTYGCPLRCSYCDTSYSYEGSDYTEMSVMEIVKEVEQYTCRRIILTGGEPLIQPDVHDLILQLLINGYTIEIETSGCVDITPYRNLYDVIVTMDWKGPSSKMHDKMVCENLHKLRDCDVLKFVVGSIEDLEEMKTILHLAKPSCHIFVSPVLGSIQLQDIVNYILENNIQNVRFQLQIHKYIWDPSERGV